MKEFFIVLKAECKKQHLNYFHSKLIYISLFVWPIISFISTYFSFKPFEMSKITITYVNENNLIVFLMIGYMTMSLFRSLVQSAWIFSMERISGTLELIYLSPASRIAVIMGNVISSLFESVVVMVIFSLGVFIVKREVMNINYGALFVVLLITITMAIVWGMMLNALFLFSRDSSFLFTILEEPMEIFSGVKVPTLVFPSWAKVISVIFPLTYAVEAMRNVILNGTVTSSIVKFMFIATAIIFIQFMFTFIGIRVVEIHSRKTGNFILY